MKVWFGLVCTPFVIQNLTQDVASSIGHMGAILGLKQSVNNFRFRFTFLPKKQTIVLQKKCNASVVNGTQITLIWAIYFGRHDAC